MLPAVGTLIDQQESEIKVPAVYPLHLGEL